MEVEVEEEQVFTAHEVDIDYEFDAARFFDFSREETPVEARRAELWFESAKTYPPSRKPLSISAWLKRRRFGAICISLILNG